MQSNTIKITYIGGPTALIEIGGLRMLTDPTFDPAGTEYKTNVYTLKKFEGPAINADSIGHIDIVLLSHDHHFDNLDHAGRTILASADKVLTTPAGAERLGGNAVGLSPWQTIELPSKDKRTLRFTGTPARHGPPAGDRGPVTGFAIAFNDAPQNVLYISGDTVWYEGVEEVSRRFKVTTAVLFLGAAKVPEVGPDHLTMTADEGVIAAKAFSNADIIPLHFEGWRHFSQSRHEIEKVFKAAGLQNRLHLLKPGSQITLEHLPK
jgi:L-ascorbate metabolism protein UlaG (beta-lactamase superfamily)